ncbi:MAG TPA: protein kinase [Vicinamibacteria bacterium]|nr:protein kinase [Vicinamibacteria bacterium]
MSPPDRLGSYEIMAELGSGGMGVVYRARDSRLQRDVAIKVLSAHGASDLERRKRFEREARAASALDHPNIVTIHEIGETEDGQLFLVMQLVEGKRLRA